MKPWDISFHACIYTPEHAESNRPLVAARAAAYRPRGHRERCASQPSCGRTYVYHGAQIAHIRPLPSNDFPPHPLPPPLIFPKGQYELHIDNLVPLGPLRYRLAVHVLLRIARVVCLGGMVDRVVYRCRGVPYRGRLLGRRLAAFRERL